jgi:phosphoadenosine phosphosulfate reductase
MAANDLPQLCFSGGNDSVCIKALADMAGLEYKAVYSVTTIDPPELYRFIKYEHSDVERRKPEINFFHKFVEMGFPLRNHKWCCRFYKHNTGFNDIKIVGIRAEESGKRKANWKTITRWNEGGGKLAFCPILFWTFKDRTEFIKGEGLKKCGLYDEGFERLGCIGCPCAKPRERRMQLDRWPRYEMLYRLAFARLWDKRAGTIDKNGNQWFGSRKFNSSDEMFDWWITDESTPDDLDCEADTCDMGLF